jgi:hypothetical protein
LACGQQKALHDGVVLTGPILRQKWTDFANHAHISEDDCPKLSDGWLTKFKLRHGLKEQRRHGEAASANPQSVDHERARMQLIIENSGFKPRDIFNFDESAVLWSYVPVLTFPSIVFK